MSSLGLSDDVAIAALTCHRASVVGFSGPLQNHMVRAVVVPLLRIGRFSQLCS
jgi:hypothetical protein